jgi:adenylate cyclase
MERLRALISEIHRRSVWQALELNPFITRQIATTFGVLRRWDEANAVEDRMRVLRPEDIGAWLALGTIPYRQGKTEEARAEIERAVEAGAGQSRVPRYLAMTYVAERRYDEALALLESDRHQDFMNDDFMEPRTLQLARVLDLVGRAEEAGEAYRAAQSWLEARLAEEPDHAYGHAALGLALAGLGERERAMEAGRRAMELQPLDHDAFAGTYVMDLVAGIYAEVGESHVAIDLIEQLLERPSFMTVPRLQMEPTWDSLRGDPRFQALLQRYG